MQNGRQTPKRAAAGERQDESQTSVRTNARSETAAKATARSETAAETKSAWRQAAALGIGQEVCAKASTRQSVGALRYDRRAQGVRANARCTTHAKTESAWGAPRRVADQLQDEPKTSVSNAYPLPVVWLPRCFSLISLHRFPPLSSQSFSSCNWSLFRECCLGCEGEMPKNHVFEKSRKRQEELETDGPVGFQLSPVALALSRRIYVFVYMSVYISNESILTYVPDL